MSTTRFFNIFTLSLLAAAIAFSAAPKKYGKKISLKEKTKISDIMANPQKYDGQRVLVEGAVTDVCQAQGCWIKIMSDDCPEQVRFKVKDGEIVFPVNAKGKNALAEGIVSVKTKTQEELIEEGEHFAKDEGKQFDPSTVTGPKTVVTIKGEGAVLK